MRLSVESRRARWALLGGVWLAVAVLLYLHAVAMRDHLAMVGRLGLRGQPAATTPFALTYAPGAVDAQEWVQHAYSLLNGPGIRLRHTDIDNTPFGREVHWNSGWAWMIAGAGKLYQRATGDSLTRSLEEATLWLNPAVLLGFIVLFSWYAGRRAGAAAGVAVAIAMVGHPQLYEGFNPTHVAHHGLVTALDLGLVLGAIFAGAGWLGEDANSSSLVPQSPASARGAAIFSAVCGAFGLWVSAASVVPAIAIVGAAGAITVLASGRAALQSGLRYDGQVWRIWGRVGAAGSIFFYLVEYFPFHLGLRLEANHPLYALAWLGGGELIAEVTERWLAAPEVRSRDPKRLLLPLALVLAAPLTIGLLGSAVFTPMDPFLSHMYRTYLPAFAPLWAQLKDGFRWNPYYSIVGIANIPLLAGVGLLIMRGRRVSPVVWFAIAVTLSFTLMAWMQNRWLRVASGSQICLALVLVTYFTAGRRPARRWASTLAVAGVLFFPNAILRITDLRAQDRDNVVLGQEDMQVLYRDMAAALRASQPSGEIRLLADVNTSISAGYFGQLKTVGTTFWENLAGLKGAAAIWTAPGIDSAAELIRARGITHVAIVSDADFSAVFLQMLHPYATEDEYHRTFGYQLIGTHAVPEWLRPIPYSVPDDLGPHTGQILLYKVDFTPDPANTLYRRALSELASGDSTSALHDFDALIGQDSGTYLAWLGKSGLLFARRDWTRAADAAIHGIAHAPTADRVRLSGWMAGNFLREQQAAQAVRLYRLALQDGYNPDVGCSLAFVLATATEDRLRNGVEALSLARRAVDSRSDSPLYLNCLGTALAETHHFPEAIVAENRAIGAARAQGDTNTVRISEQLLAAFRAGRPWRE